MGYGLWVIVTKSLQTNSGGRKMYGLAGESTVFCMIICLYIYGMWVILQLRLLRLSNTNPTSVVKVVIPRDDEA